MFINQSRASLIFWLILAVFFLKGLFLSGSLPMLSGQDEARHYVTIQHLAEPRSERKDIMGWQNNNLDGFEKYITSEELAKTIELSNLSDFQGSASSKPDFYPGFDGENEKILTKTDWDRKITGDLASLVGGEKLYHYLSSRIEVFLGHKHPDKILYD